MKRFRKLISVAAAAALLCSIPGCAMADVAGTDPGTPEFTEQDRQDLENYIREQFGEEAVQELLGTPDPQTIASPTPEAAVTTPSPEKTEGDTAGTAAVESRAAEFPTDGNGRGTLNYEEYVQAHRSVNPDALDPYIERLKTYALENPADPDAGNTVVQIYRDLAAAFDEECTQASFSAVLSAKDVTDEKASEAAVRDRATLEMMRNKARTAVGDVLRGPYGQALKAVLSAEETEVFLAEKERSERAALLLEKAASLNTEYQSVMAKEVSANYNGRIYTSADSLPEKDKEAISQLLLRARAEAVQPIYTQLLHTLNDYAGELGYADYPEYAYRSVFGRDYSQEEVRKLSSSIRDLLMSARVNAILCAGQADPDAPLTADPEAQLDVLSGRVTGISNELVNSLAYLRSHRLYLIDNDRKMLDSRFTYPLPSVHTAIIYKRTSKTLKDYCDLVHEFGRWNSYYQVHAPNLAVNPHPDVLGIHAMGLELLLSEGMDDLVPLERGDYGALITSKMLNQAMKSIMLAGFELDAFANPDRSAQEFTALLHRHALACMPGMPAEENPSDYDYLWMESPQLFASPLYDVSFAFASLSALDIYSTWLENPSAAYETYTRIVHVDPRLSYRQALQEAGMRDMTAEDSIREVCGILETHYRNQFETSLIQAEKEGNAPEVLEAAENGFRQAG